MDPTPTSYFLAAKTAHAWRQRGIIEAGAVSHLIDMATHAALPCIRKAARRVVGDVGCAHMIPTGERRRAV